MIYTVSARRKPPDVPILTFLKRNYGAYSFNEIDSVFGFLEISTLYGGRNYIGPELTPDDVVCLYSVNIGVRIPLTNHYVDAHEYQKNMPLLDRYHRDGNAVIITNDDLAMWVRKDFPKYRIEASVIKDIDSYQKIDEAFELYDTVVLPMHLNTDHEFLGSIGNKQRITLFANAGCALTCPSKICYPAFSKMNKYTGAEYRCSQPLKDRQQMGMIDFELDVLVNLGFNRFKLLRSQPKELCKSGWQTGF